VTKKVTTRLKSGRKPLDKAALLRAYLLAQKRGKTFVDLADEMDAKVLTVYQSMRKIKLELRAEGIFLPDMPMKPSKPSVGDLVVVANEFGFNVTKERK
jgi:hypothetical protein